MATADKVLSILGLFTMEQPNWTVDAIASTLALSGSTAYQYVGSLVAAGLLTSDKSGRYTIGPAVIEMDRLLRRFDPLIHEAQGPLHGLVEAIEGEAIGLLCRIYRLRVMCVDQAVRHAPTASISYERGRPMPLTRGAASKSILAHLGTRTLRRFYDSDPIGVAAAGLGDGWEAFRRTMRQMRKAGVLVTVGELDPGMMGISAPVFDGQGEVLGSIGLVVPAYDYPEGSSALAQAGVAVAEAAATLTAALATA
ncbi:IclR family transcriptional regulator [Sphingomonas sp. 22176]|uniref:IclR family transcriptional regulator n=1 Tax=Sphingomonas sp. 22176 TaxID=3453884 RepID=UPI003F83F5EB